VLTEAVTRNAAAAEAGGVDPGGAQGAGTQDQ